LARRVLLLNEALDYVSRAGIPVLSYAYARGVDGVLKAAEEIGYPVALKIVSGKAIHKSEIGGVILDIDSPEKLKRAVEDMVERMEKLGIPVEGFIVQKMAEPGAIEGFVGVLRDPIFGPLVGFGAGGILVELYGDVVFDLAPTDKQYVIRLLEGETRFGKLLMGKYRGLGPYDYEGFAEVVEKVSRLAWEDKRLLELDLNPVLIYRDKVLVVDARVVLEA